MSYCVERIGKRRIGWDTLMVSGASDTTIPTETLWAAWSDLDHWPAWSPLHKSVTRDGTGALAVGASFNQQIGLGFPIGTTTEVVTISLLEPEDVPSRVGFR